MAITNKETRLYEFGPFRVDPEHRLLLRENQPVPLQPKAFDVLLVLIQNHEKVVLKDDLLKAVWPETFVEESNLAQNIFVLRKALGEVKGGSRYIVTVPGRGYRFAERVAEVPEPGGSLIVHSRSLERMKIKETSRSSRRFLRVGAVLLLLVGCFIGYRIYRFSRVPRATIPTARQGVSPRRSVAVLGFRDLSARPEEAWLSTALAEMLSTELAAGEKLRLIPGEDIARTKVDLRLPDADSFSKDTLARVRNSLGADLVVLGSYTTLGTSPKGSIRLDLRLQDAIGGEIVAELARTGTEDDLFDLVSQAGTQLRENLGLGAVSSSEAVSVKASLPRNPEAARLYAEGLAKLRMFDALAARNLLQQSTVADPGYPLSRAALAGAWSALGYDRKAREEANHAFQLATNLSREDRLVVEGGYRMATHEYEKAIDVYRTLFTLFPDNLDYGLRLAQAQTRGSKSNDALATVTTLRKLPSPASSDPRIDLQEAIGWIWTSNSQRAQEPLKHALEKGRAQRARLFVALALRWQCRSSSVLGHVGDAVAACREARDTYAAAGDHSGEAGVLRLWADAIRQSDAPGPPRVRQSQSEAMDLYRQALSLFRGVGDQEGMGVTTNSMGLLYALQGDASAAEKTHHQALAIFRRIANTASMGVVAQNLGDDRVLQGDLPGATEFYDEAQVLDREAGDAGAVMGVGYDKAIIQELHGELSGAKTGFEESLRQWQKEQDLYDAGYGFLDLGAVLLKQADLPGARRAFEQSLAIRKAGEDKIIFGETQMALADLSLEEGRAPCDVETTARSAIDEFKKESAWEDEGLAWALLARALFAEHKFDEAKHAAAEAISFYGKTPHLELRMNNAIVAARVRALEPSALSNPAVRQAAMNQLASVIAESKKRGYLGVELEARLLLCQIEAVDNQAMARRHAKLLEDDARSKGFVLIARKAHAVA